MWRATTLAVAAVGVAILTLALAVPQARASGSGGVLVVGDSLEVLTSPYLERYLPGIPLTVNAEGGYNSYQIFDLFKESYEPSQSVIVFDAGTNDNPAYPQILAGNLTAVAQIVGDRCMVVPTIHGFTVDGVGNEGKNLVVAEFAASRPGTQVPAWARVVATHPELMQADNLHPTPEGADYRARLIAAGVKRCLGFATASNRPRKPVLRSEPEMPLVGRLMQRQRELVISLATRLAYRVVVGVAGRDSSLAAVLTAASLHFGCEDRLPLCKSAPSRKAIVRR